MCFIVRMQCDNSVSSKGRSLCSKKIIAVEIQNTKYPAYKFGTKTKKGDDVNRGITNSNENINHYRENCNVSNCKLTCKKFRDFKGI